jgi:hypothetical protein
MNIEDFEIVIIKPTPESKRIEYLGPTIVEYPDGDSYENYKPKIIDIGDISKSVNKTSNF